MKKNSNGWDEYKKLILHELKENSDTLKQVSKDVSDMKSDIASLKVKAAIAGGFAGLIGTGLLSAVLAAFR